MANWETEHFVKITPRRKNDWGFASMGNDYNNFESAEEYNAYYEKLCKNIVENLEDHYKDFDIKRIEVATNEREQELEEKLDKLHDEISDLKLTITETMLNVQQATDYNSLVDIFNELNKIINKWLEGGNK